MTNDQPDSDRGTRASSLRADDPIRSIENDLLSRGRLFKVIAGHILATDGRESVVIGLNAPWGAGKSSFLNLLEERLTSDGPGSEKESTKNRQSSGSIPGTSATSNTSCACFSASLRSVSDRAAEPKRR